MANENENDKTSDKQAGDNVIDKLQLYGDNVILLKLDNTYRFYINNYINNYLYICII